jgi:hypothetical protein
MDMFDCMLTSWHNNAWFLGPPLHAFSTVLGIKYVCLIHNIGIDNGFIFFRLRALEDYLRSKHHWQSTVYIHKILQLKDLPSMIDKESGFCILIQLFPTCCMCSRSMWACNVSTSYQMIFAILLYIGAYLTKHYPFHTHTILYGPESSMWARVNPQPSAHHPSIWKLAMCRVKPSVVGFTGITY